MKDRDLTQQQQHRTGARMTTTDNTTTQARAPGTVPALVRRHTIEQRSSPVCMGVQRRIVSRDGHQGPWVCGTMSEVWKAYKRMRKAANTQLRRIDGSLIDESETLTMKELVEKNKRRLFGASLYRADMSRADLRGADMSGADIREANMDYSAWPLWCGSKNVRVDKKIAAQLAMHFCWLDCDDEEVKAAQEAVKSLAKQCRHWEDK